MLSHREIINFKTSIVFQVKMAYVWILLVVSRIVWCLLPQTGYIHPDEFFQSTEVIAGEHKFILAVVKVQITSKY